MVGLDFFRKNGWVQVWQAQFKKNGLRLWVYYDQYDPYDSYITVTNGLSDFDENFIKYEIYDGPRFDAILEFLKDPEPTMEKLDSAVERRYIMDLLDQME